MMDHENFELVFKGEVIDGFDLEQVKAGFARLFKLSDEKVEQVFKPPSLVIRKGLSEERATRYQRRLEKIGMRTLVVNCANRAVFIQQSNAPVSETMLYERAATPVAPVVEFSAEREQRKFIWSIAIALPMTLICVFLVTLDSEAVLLALFSFFMFPSGLFVVLPFLTENGLYIFSILGYLYYIAIISIAFYTKKPRFLKALRYVLIASLIINVSGCTFIVSSVFGIK